MYLGSATNCIFWQDSPVEVYHTSLSFSSVSGNPYFVSAAEGDFRLQPGSPCIDTGTAAGAPANDLLGVPRPQGAGVDMGAYEALVPVTMPDLSGLARAAAREMIAAAQLYVRSETDEYHRTVPNGHVIRQTPVAGVQVLSNSPVDLVISKGPQPVPAPDVIGQTQDAATAAITGAGLVVGTVTQVYSLTVPAGTVMAQNPVGGVEVLPGTAVDLVVSRGGISVPDLTGQAQSAASTVLTTAGLAVGTVTLQYNLIVPVGSVISQSVAAGTLVLPGAVVDLVVSKGGIAVPVVTGQAQSAAVAAFTNAGLALGVVTQQNSATVPVGAVIAQTPAAGTPVLPGTAVDLVVSRGAAPSVMPDVVGQTQTQAQAAITDAGLTPGIITQAHSDSVAAGSVMAQSPPAGTELPAGTLVSIVVSMGPAPVVEGEGEPVNADTARQQLSDGFDSADKNSDGNLSFTEASAAIPGLTQAVFGELDTDGDGQLSADELGVDQGTGCAGCQGGKSAFHSSGITKGLSDMFLTGLGLIGLAAMATVRRP